MEEEQLYHKEDEQYAPKMTFILGMILNLLFVVIEFWQGYKSNSTSLLSDAGHNLGDVISLGLSLLAFKMSQSSTNLKYTYGYSKSTILSSLLNVIILLVAVIIIGYEAISKFLNPQPVNGITITIIAGIGILINTGSALLFFKNKEHELNSKGAFLHLITDALVSAGVVIAGIIIYFTKWNWVDPVISIFIIIMILYSTWGLLKDSIRLAMDGVPSQFEVEVIKKEVSDNIVGVINIHHVHIWALSTTRSAMTTHVLFEKNLTPKEIISIKSKITEFLQAKGIHHVTLETDYEEHS